MCAPSRGAVTHYEAVFEDRVYQLFHIIRNDETAALEQSEGLGGPEQSGSAARADAEFDFRVLTGAIHDLNHVVDEWFGNVNLTAFVL